MVRQLNDESVEPYDDVLAPFGHVLLDLRPNRFRDLSFDAEWNDRGKEVYEEGDCCENPYCDDDETHGQRGRLP